MADQFVYTNLDNGIHQMTWHEVNSESVQGYMDLYTELVTNFSGKGILRILHDYRNSETPSFITMANGMKTLIVRDEVTPRIAHIYSDLMYPMMVKNATLVSRFNAHRKFFNAMEEAQAIEWLLRDE